MEIKPGYKLTEVGIIPDDWQVGQTGNLVKKIKSGLSRRLQSEDIGIPVLTSSNIQNNRLVTDELKYWFTVDPQGANTGNYVLDNGDILLCFINSIAQIGKPCLFKDIGRPVIYTTNIFRIVVTEQSVPEFAYYLFSSKSFQESIQTIVKPAVNQASFTKPDFLQIRIPLPPTLAEQQVIAETLCDADALIESLELLIAKKRQIKQGVMQELLTGRKRLPGFRGEWNNIQYRNLLDYERPDQYIVENAEYIEHGDIPVLTANKSFVLGYTSEVFGICRNLPVIMFDDFTTDSKYVDFPFKVKSSAIKLLRPKHNQVDLGFIFGLIKSIQFPIGDHKRYYISEFQHILVNVPDYEEQKAIAIVINDMNSEIVSLEQKLAKTHLIKQGMMHELLTGRIRLV